MARSLLQHLNSITLWTKNTHKWRSSHCPLKPDDKGHKVFEQLTLLCRQEQKYILQTQSEGLVPGSLEQNPNLSLYVSPDISLLETEHGLRFDLLWRFLHGKLSQLVEALRIYVCFSGSFLH